MSIDAVHNQSTHSHIVVVGSFVVDFSMRLPRLLQRGESLVGSEFLLGPGGKGTNTAVAVARQQQEVKLIERVGDDQFASMAYDLYQQEHIDATYVLRTPGISTSLGFSCIEPSGDNAIAVYLGANQALSPDDVSRAEQVFHQASVVITQFETPDETISLAFRLARQHAACCILIPGPTRPFIADYFSLVDILIPNKGEARVLVGLKPEDESVGIAEVGRQLVEKGARNVIITLGGEGSLLVRPGEDPLHIPAYNEVDIVNTVGAGDAFNGGLAVALNQGLALPDAISRATVTAALSCRVMGSIAGLPTWAEVDEHLVRYTRIRGNASAQAQGRGET